MSNSPALVEVQSNLLTPPWKDLCQLPAKLTKRLWVSPSAFLTTTHALAIAEWAVGLWTPPPHVTCPLAARSQETLPRP